MEGKSDQVENHTINYHLREIYKTNELSEAATTQKIRVVQQEGKRQVERELQYYSLDAIISVGYRVNSKRATHFRIWATGVLREYMIKEFAMDDERLKQDKTAFSKDYFRELLERVRSIRASERRIWHQVTDIFDRAGEYFYHVGICRQCLVLAAAEQGRGKSRRSLIS